MNGRWRRWDNPANGRPWGCRRGGYDARHGGLDHPVPGRVVTVLEIHVGELRFIEGGVDLLPEGAQRRYGRGKREAVTQQAEPAGVRNLSLASRAKPCSH